MRFICSLINILSRPFAGIGEKVKSSIRTASYFAIFFMALLYGSVLGGVHLLIKCIVGAVLMGIAILFTADGKVKPVKWSIPGVILWFGLGLIQLLSGLFVSLEYLPMAMIWLVGFPAMFIVFGSRDGEGRTELFAEAARAANLALIIMLVGSVLLVPLTHRQYGGILNNSNGVGQWITFGYAAVLFLYYNGGNSKKLRILYGVEISMIFLFMFISRGRTAALSILAMSVVFVVCRLKFIKNDWRYWLKRIPMYALCLLLTVAVTIGVNWLVAERLNEALRFPDKFDNDVFDSIDDDESDETQPEFGELLDSFIGRFLGKDKAGTGLNNLSSGRTGIWIETIRMLNLLGHHSSEHIITDRNGDVGVNVHNTPLQFAFDNGVFAGILYTALVVYGGVVMLKRTKKSRTLHSTDAFFLVIHAGYCVTTLLASVNLPFLYLIAFLYYMTYASALEGSGETKETKQAKKG